MQGPEMLPGTVFVPPQQGSHGRGDVAAVLWPGHVAACFDRRSASMTVCGAATELDIGKDCYHAQLPLGAASNGSGHN